MSQIPLNLQSKYEIHKYMCNNVYSLLAHKIYIYIYGPTLFHLCNVSHVSILFSKESYIKIFIFNDALFFKILVHHHQVPHHYSLKGIIAQPNNGMSSNLIFYYTNSLEPYLKWMCALFNLGR